MDKKVILAALTRQATPLLRSARCYVALTACVASGLCAAQSSQEELRDLSGRVEYAFYAADLAALEQAIRALDKVSATETQPSTLANEQAFARWKLAQLQVTGDRDAASRSADACVDAIAPKATALQQALAAACYAVLAEARPLRGAWYRHVSEQHLQQALQLDSKQPQVQWIAAWIAIQREPAAAASYAALKKVVARLDESAATSTDWGYAEAFYLLGKLEWARHDVLAARNALERAAVLAPDYRDVQALLKQLNVN